MGKVIPTTGQFYFILQAGDVSAGSRCGLVTWLLVTSVGERNPGDAIVGGWWVMDLYVFLRAGAPLAPRNRAARSGRRENALALTSVRAQGSKHGGVNPQPSVNSDRR